MSRPLRIEYPGAVYHVTSRGNRREAIYRDDADRQAHLAVVAHALERFDAQALAYCLMGNHYHLVLHTCQANLSRLMRHINGVYTQAFNHRHGLVGHLFQGRFKAILVDTDAYLMALCRYVERNPVAAGIALTAAQWPWSSYQARTAAAAAPAWLDLDALWGQMLGRPPANASDRRTSAQRYAALVNGTGANEPTIWAEGLRQQIYLGDQQFVDRMQAQADPIRADAAEVPRAQRLGVSTSLAERMASAGDRSQALLAVYREGRVTMTALAHELGLSVSRVSRLISRAEKAAEEAKDKT